MKLVSNSTISATVVAFTILLASCGEDDSGKPPAVTLDPGSLDAEHRTAAGLLARYAYADAADLLANVVAEDPSRTDARTDLAIAVIEELTNRLRETNEQASSLSFQGVKERTRGLFERLAEADPSTGARMTPVLTHQQIADMIGTSRETVTRAIKQLKVEGWLEQMGKRYVVPAPN